MKSRPDGFDDRRNNATKGHTCHHTTLKSVIQDHYIRPHSVTKCNAGTILSNK